MCIRDRRGTPLEVTRTASARDRGSERGGGGAAEEPKRKEPSSVPSGGGGVTAAGTTNRWSDAERLRLVEGVEAHGMTAWEAVAEAVRTKTSTQCRNYYANYRDRLPSVKKEKPKKEKGKKKEEAKDDDGERSKEGSFKKAGKGDGAKPLGKPLVTDRRIEEFGNKPGSPSKPGVKRERDASPAPPAKAKEKLSLIHI